MATSRVVKPKTAKLIADQLRTAPNSSSIQSSISAAHQIGTDFVGIEYTSRVSASNICRNLPQPIFFLFFTFFDLLANV